MQMSVQDALVCECAGTQIHNQVLSCSLLPGAGGAAAAGCLAAVCCAWCAHAHMRIHTVCL